MTPHDYLSSLPGTWKDALRRFRIEPIDRGMSEAQLFRLNDGTASEFYLKILSGDELPGFRSEVERTRWLAARGVRVPSFLRVFEDSSIGACLMTALSGRHPQEIQKPILETIRDLAEGLFALHSLPAIDCPFDETVTARLARARRMIRRGLIDPECFDERNQGLAPETIYARLLRSIPKHEDLVVVHGDTTFDNLLIDDDGQIGFVDCGRAGRGDRYVDLSTIITDIQEYFGPDWTDRFAISYNEIKLDMSKLTFFSDLYELF
jgi:aminoglycoside 3'-phosphotransferase II